MTVATISVERPSRQTWFVSLATRTLEDAAVEHVRRGRLVPPRARLPGHRDRGCDRPPFGPMSDDELRRGAERIFLAAVERRAPRWMQQHGLRRLFRLAYEPRRLRHRQPIENLQFVLGVVGDVACRRPAA